MSDFETREAKKALMERYQDRQEARRAEMTHEISGLEALPAADLKSPMTVAKALETFATEDV